MMGRFRIRMDFLFEELERFDCSESISCLAVSFGGVDNALSRDFFASGCFSGVLETDASELLLSSVALAFLPNRIGRQWNSSVARLDFLLGEVNEDAVGVSPPELVDEIDIMEALFLCLVNLSGRNSQAPVFAPGGCNLCCFGDVGSGGECVGVDSESSHG